MPEKDSFQDADKTFPLEAPNDFPLKRVSSELGELPSGMLEQREKLLKNYHKGQKSLAERLHHEGRNDIDSLVLALVDELIKETDSLLGNELLAVEESNLRDATIISDKRAGVIEKAIKAVQAKQEFEREKGTFDLDSPAMKVVFKFFMAKVKGTFKDLHYADEQSDIFFRKLGNNMSDWKKDLKDEFQKLNTIGSV